MEFNELKGLIQYGLVTDMLKAQEAYTVLKTIGEKSAEINKSEIFVMNTFAYFQQLSLNEYVMSIARLFDNPSRQNQNRCLKVLIEELMNKPESFPVIEEKYQTIKQIIQYQLNETLIESLEKDDFIEFNKRLGGVFLSKYEGFQDQRKKIKEWRDKILAHNDKYNSTVQINFRNTNDLLDFSWMVVTIVGWAHLSTIYGYDGKNHLKEEARMRGKYVRLTLDKAI